MSDKYKFILASASPRRHDLLCTAGIPHEIFVTDADENPKGSPADGEMYAAWFAREASILKGSAAVCELMKKPISEQVFVISADTVVSPDGCAVFGKPADASDARRMLRALSGGEHFVVGGITVTELSDCQIKNTASSSVVTKVRFKNLSEAEISAYIDSGEPFGKAGAYAIQGLGGVFVTGIDGDYQNVVGISTAVLCEMLNTEFSLKITENFREIIEN